MWMFAATGRLIREVRPTFLPYGRAVVRTRLSQEECAGRLMRVTQPQKMPTLFSARTSPEERVVFKGQVSRTGFFAVPVSNKDSGHLAKYNGVQPFWIRGLFRYAFGGTEVVVQVVPDFPGLLPLCAALVVFVALTVFGIHDILTPGSRGQLLGAVTVPLLLVCDLFLWSGIALPASLQAYKIKKTLHALLN